MFRREVLFYLHLVFADSLVVGVPSSGYLLAAGQTQKISALSMRYPSWTGRFEKRLVIVRGTIKNHPSIPDGDVITTSPY
jgi:hypothetical protein